jgi:ElaA protein
MRAEVFVQEQNCPYTDPDHYDLISYHVFLSAENQYAAYARIIPPGKKYAEVAIGRVLTTSAFRGKGLGKLLFKFCIDECGRLFPGNSIRISAQSYLREFYSSFGFVVQGEEYLEDNIPHFEMLLSR